MSEIEESQKEQMETGYGVSRRDVLLVINGVRTQLFDPNY